MELVICNGNSDQVVITFVGEESVSNPAPPNCVNGFLFRLENEVWTTSAELWYQYCDFWSNLTLVKKKKNNEWRNESGTSFSDRMSKPLFQYLQQWMSSNWGIFLFSHILSYLLTACVLVALFPCLRWNY